MRISQLNIARLMAVLAVSFLSIVSFAFDSHTSSKFSGAKVNAGTVTHTTENGKSILTLSDDFIVPDTPDPHWQVVDSDGNVYELDKLKVKSLIGDKFKKQIVVPNYVKNVAKVQIWCAFAEVNLGEASFASPVK